jgi:hypothetical protein
VLGFGHDLLAKKGQQGTALILQGLRYFRIHGGLAGTLLLARINITRQAIQHDTFFFSEPIHDIAKPGSL